MSFIVIVGAGRVGSAVARNMLSRGHEVSVLDEDPLSHERLEVGLDGSWEDLGGRFTVGHGMELEALAGGRPAGRGRLHRLDRRRQHEPRHRPDRPAPVRGAEGRRARHGPRAGRVVRAAGAADDLPDGVRDPDVRAGARGGLGRACTSSSPAAARSAGTSRASSWPRATRSRSSRATAAATSSSSRSSSTPCSTATPPSCGSSSAPGIQRADLVIAVTGDDEDNLLICQIAKEKYLCERIIARVNNPRNRSYFELLGIQPAVSATDLILRLIEHEVPSYGLVHLLDLRDEQLEIIELEVADQAPAAGRSVAEVALPDGASSSPCCAGGAASCPRPTRSSSPATRSCSCSTRARAGRHACLHGRRRAPSTRCDAAPALGSDGAPAWPDGGAAPRGTARYHARCPCRVV